MTIWTWPVEWYSFTSLSMSLKPISVTSPHTWTGGKGVSRLGQLWLVKVTLGPQAWDENGQAMAAFFDLVGGQGGLVRIGDPVRQRPLRDRLLAASSAEFSDGSKFSDGTGFDDDYLPNFVTIDAAVQRGATYLVLSGFPASETAVLRRGDLIEFRPNGIPAGGPSLHSVMFNSNSDANGKSGIQISPPLRRDLAAGDMAVLVGATSVFRLIDDEQGVPEISPGNFMATGFALVEAMDQTI